MCGGMEFRHHPEQMTEEEWHTAVRGSGAGLDKGYWKLWHPVQVMVHPDRWMEKNRRHVSCWFDLAAGKGILCLHLDLASGTPLYVVTRPAGGDYLTDIHDRIPVVTC